jgi:hypothetical protein
MKRVLREVFAFETPKIVEVWWTDAYAQNAWHPRSKKERERGAVKTVGYLIHDDDIYITVARSVGTDDSGQEHGDPDDEGTLNIPRGMIVKLRQLAPPRSK